MATSKFKMTQQHIDMILAIRLMGAEIQREYFIAMNSQICDDLLKNDYIDRLTNDHGQWFVIVPNFIDRNYDHFCKMMINTQQ